MVKICRLRDRGHVRYLSLDKLASHSFGNIFRCLGDNTVLVPHRDAALRMPIEVKHQVLPIVIPIWFAFSEVFDVLHEFQIRMPCWDVGCIYWVRIKCIIFCYVDTLPLAFENGRTFQILLALRCLMIALALLILIAKTEFIIFNLLYLGFSPILGT